MGKKHFIAVISTLKRDRRGAALIEMALVLPLLVTMLTGIVSYGKWLYIAHGIQQVANDAARAAIAGLDSAERAALAEKRVDTDLRRTGNFDPLNVGMLIDDNGETLVVHVTYDADADPLMHLSVVPVPETMIERTAAIQLGGL